MKNKRKNELVTIMTLKAILQENVTKRNKIGKNKFKGFSQIIIIRKIELLITVLS
jgi:hypothetical protein